MATCRHHHRSWPREVQAIYDRAFAELGNIDCMHFGPSHIVWEDANFEAAEWCLDHFSDYTDGYTEHELAIVRQSLVELTKIPLDERFGPEKG